MLAPSSSSSSLFSIRASAASRRVNPAPGADRPKAHDAPHAHRGPIVDCGIDRSMSIATTRDSVVCVCRFAPLLLLPSKNASRLLRSREIEPAHMCVRQPTERNRACRVHFSTLAQQIPNHPSVDRVTQPNIHSIQSTQITGATCRSGRPTRAAGRHEQPPPSADAPPKKNFPAAGPLSATAPLELTPAAASCFSTDGGRPSPKRNPSTST